MTIWDILLLMLAVGLLAGLVALAVYACWEWARDIDDWKEDMRRRRGEYPVERSDADALRSDWEAVGNDMRVAIEKYEQENVKDSNR